MIKQSLFVIAILLFTSSVYSQQKDVEIVYTSADVEIFSDIIKKFKTQSHKPVNQLIPEIGTYFIGLEYVDKTLEVADNEKLIVNLRELDCTTYAENLLALARSIKSDRATFERFTKELEKIRYRDGKRTEYPSRLHYFSDWIYNNREKDLVQTPADSFGKKYPNDLYFMSNHPESYKHLSSNPEYIQDMKEIEDELSGREYYYLPKEDYESKKHLLKEGDIIGITTNIEGLDVVHVGVLVKKNGDFHLLHASQSQRKVEISDEPVSSFIKPGSSNTGFMIARPNDIKE